MSFFEKFSLWFYWKLDSRVRRYRPPKMVYLKEILPQRFPFPKPLMRYVIKNANFEHIKKLQQACRYFYSNFNYNIIDDLCIYHSDTVKITNYYVAVPDKKVKFLRNNLYLIKSLSIASRYNNLEKFFQKIIKCEIKELYIAECCYHVKLSEFAILTKSKHLNFVKIDSYIYYSGGNTKVPIDDLISYMPNVTTFYCWKCIFTSNTMQNLFTLKRNVKFRHLWLEASIEFLDSQLFNKYIKEMVDFDNELPGMIELSGDHEKLQEIYELVKIWRPQSHFVEQNFLFIF